MFDIAPSELMLVGAVALVVIAPKDLPRALHTVGRWVGRARGVTRHFRAGIDEIIRQAEMEEMEKKWAAENARIMAEHPMPPPEEAHDAQDALAADPDLERMLAASTQVEPVMMPLSPIADEPEVPADEPELPFAAPSRPEGERG